MIGVRAIYRDFTVVLGGFFFSSRRRHTRLVSDWSSDVCSSAWATKRWAPEGFAAVIGALAGEGARCVVLGAPDEAALAQEINRLAGGRATVLAGRTDLATLVAVVDRLALLVANDSAPMHIACARGVPVVAVFCATTPALGYGPWGPRAVVVEADLA